MPRAGFRVGSAVVVGVPGDRRARPAVDPVDGSFARAQVRVPPHARGWVYVARPRAGPETEHGVAIRSSADVRLGGDRPRRGTSGGTKPGV